MELKISNASKVHATKRRLFELKTFFKKLTIDKSAKYDKNLINLI